MTKHKLWWQGALVALLAWGNGAVGAQPGEVLSLQGDVAGGNAGSALLDGLDADGDGLPDLLVGATGAESLYLVLDVEASSTGRLLSDNSVVFALSASPSALVLSSRDINDDGIDDILLGLPDVEPGGVVAVFLGRSAWPATLSATDDADVLITLDQQGTSLGASLAFVPRAGGTSQEDLIVGAPGLNQNAGGVFRIPVSALSAATTSPVSVLDLSDLTWVTTGGTEARLGASAIRAPDLDGDGTDDLVIGAPGAATGGEVYVVPTTFDDQGATDLETYPSFECLSPGAEAGTALLGTGDLDGDGYGDLLVGAPSYGGGQVYLLQGRATFSSDEPMFLARMVLGSSNSGDRLGGELASVPDLDGDGRPEFLVAAPGYATAQGIVGLFLSAGQLDAHDAIDDADLLLSGAGPGAAFGSALSSGSIGFIGAPGEPLDTASGMVYGIDFVSLAVDNDEDTFSVFQNDCDDTDPNTYPGADEICDGKDNDCDGNVGLDELDSDGDGYPACTGPNGEPADCDDGDPAVYPNAKEICDGKDNDCLEGIPDDEVDADGDGYFTCSEGTGEIDCDDTESTVHPGAPELCDGLDNDCDGIVPADEIDNDDDGYYACSSQSGPTDCDDTSASIYPGAEEICDGLDDDCDGLIPEDERDSDGDGFALCALDGKDIDCDDTSALVYPGADEMCDGLDDNCDDTIPSNETDQDGDGFFVCTNDTQPDPDCDDTNATVYPGASEVCDGIDNDCDGVADADSDGDGYYDCNDPDHPELRDCDDTNAAVYPGATEQCNGVDDDCDGMIPADESDADGDGYRPCSATGSDCDDTDPAVYPGATEVCDGKDDDCDGTLGEGEVDADGDGHFACADGGSDCDDTDPTVYDGADEACDGKDNDCDGVIPINEADEDGDGYRVCNGDCDDTSPATYPGAEEICDGLDNDCDGAPATGENDDRDGDGYTPCEGDCDDSNPRIHPGAEEVFDGKDNDCNGAVDDVPCVDMDGDGYPVAECVGSGELDCNDFDPTVYPGAPEGVRTAGPGSPMQGDGVDNNCNNVVDEGTTSYDDDGDGWSEEAGDCDDSNPDVSPSALEILGDGIDNDCDGLVDFDDPRTDNDGDGYANEDAAGNTLDCNDADQTINPSATEGPECDGVDNNCNGLIDDGLSCSDDDGDGYSEDDGDCNDALANVYPGADEVDDGLDNDCDGIVDQIGTYDGPGIGCSGLGAVSGVAFSCSTGPGQHRSGSGGAIVFLIAVASVASRRRKT